MTVSRVQRPVEDAVLQDLRKELEPHGFRYKARKMVKQMDQWRVLIYLFRARWIESDEEVFDVLAEYEIVCSTTGRQGGTVLSLSSAAHDGSFYGESRSAEPQHVTPEEVNEDFRRHLLPIVLANNSPDRFTRALLADEFAPGVPHYRKALDRAHEAYMWAQCLGLEDVGDEAVELMRSLAREPSERDAVLFAWQSLEIPGSPV